MTERRVNYDDIASTYDGRYASGVGEGQHTIPAALRRLLRVNVSNRILEVGCGTGFWLSSFDSDHEVYGLDLSIQMLNRAQKKYPTVACGTAEQIPFQDGRFDLIYCVNAFHHFVGKELFIHEARRLLRSGGRVAMIGMDPHGQRDSWYIYDYFEGTFESDLRRFPPISQIAAWMNNAGFCDVHDSVVERLVNAQYGRAVLKHSVLQKNGTSQLILLSDEAYAAGLNRIRRDLAEAESKRQVLKFDEDISLVMVEGRTL
jgi:ubiquinone/menaquinone biosynthesis C-methylase UbiE